MHIKAYLITTYLAFFCAISGVLALICSLIELIEKLRFVSSKGIAAVTIYAAWQVAPLFVSALPITLWLATIATHYHLQMRNEHLILTILGLRSWQQARPLLSAIALLGIIVCSLKPILFEPACQTAAYHKRLIKGQQPAHLLTNAWIVPSEHESIYYPAYDTLTHRGGCGIHLTYTADGRIAQAMPASSHTILSQSSDWQPYLQGLALAAITALLLSLSSAPLLYGLAVYPTWLALTVFCK